jgi:hypothetical protein
MPYKVTLFIGNKKINIIRENLWINQAGCFDLFNGNEENRKDRIVISTGIKCIIEEIGDK